MNPDQLIRLRDCCKDETAFEQLKQMLTGNLEPSKPEINQKLVQIQYQLEQQKALTRVINRIRETLDLDVIFQTTTQEICHLLQADRVAVYRFNADWGGEFVAEFVTPGWVKLVEPGIKQIWKDTYLQENQGGRYRNHETFAVEDIYKAGLFPCHIDLLEQFQARAFAIAPILTSQKLWGLLAAYQNAGPRQWQSDELSLLAQIGDQFAVAVHQAELLRELHLEVKERQQAICNLETEMVERQRTAKALQQSEQRFRNLVETISDWVWEVDQNGVYTYVSPLICKMLGYTPEEVLGKTPFDLMPPQEAQHLREVLTPIVKERQPLICLENVCLHKNGYLVNRETSGVPIFDTTGEFLGYRGVDRDITERSRLLAREQAARAQAEAANRIKDEFLAVLSHELRSPLNPILGWTKLLRSRQCDEKTAAKALETIERNATLQTELIEDLLDISRILQGKLSLDIGCVNLVATIAAALETVRLAAEAKTIQIQFHSLIPANQRMVSGDSNRLQQVIWNLLSNAVKFTPSGGRVEIWLECVDSQAQIRVSDTGKGIALNFLPYVFEYFRQENSSTTRIFGGLGLGLAIVRHIVELHGGTVYAESPGVGQGATFTVRLPLISLDPEIHQDSRPSSSNSDLNGVKVLIVDDDADSREFFSFILQQCGAQVTVVASAAEAVKALIHSKPNVLLSDIGMPHIDGYMLIRKVRLLEADKGGQIPAIALTAYAGEIDQQQALAAGFNRHIAKPVDPDKLVRAIAELVG